MIKKLKNLKITMKLFSVILAIVVWLILIYTLDPTITQTVNNIPITFTGEEELNARGLVLKNKNEIDTINVKISGARSSVINALPLISAEVDLSDILSEGSRTESVTVNIGVSGVMMVGRTNPAVKAEIDKLVEKEVPVKIIRAGSEKNKQTIVESKPEVSTLVLKGAQSELSSVSEAQITVDVSAIDAVLTQKMDYTLVDDENTKVTCQTLVNPPEKIMVTSRLYPRKSLPVEIVLADSDKNDFALEVESQSKEKIDVGIKNYDIDMSAVYAVFNASEYKNGQSEYSLQIEDVEGLYIPDESKEITAKLLVEEKVEKYVTLKVETRNVPQKATISLLQDSVTILLRGAESKLNSEFVKGYVDVSQVGPGQIELPVNIETDEDITMVDEVYVEVNVSMQ